MTVALLSVTTATLGVTLAMFGVTAALLRAPRAPHAKDAFPPSAAAGFAFKNSQSDPKKRERGGRGERDWMEERKRRVWSGKGGREEA